MVKGFAAIAVFPLYFDVVQPVYFSLLLYLVISNHLRPRTAATDAPSRSLCTISKGTNSFAQADEKST